MFRKLTSIHAIIGFPGAATVQKVDINVIVMVIVMIFLKMYHSDVKQIYSQHL